MTSDFIERVVTMLENNVAARSSELLGEEDAATAKALRLIGPTIFAGLVMEGTSTEGASRLLDMIRSSPFSTGLGDDLLGVIKHRQARTGAQQRESLCVRLFKDHLDPLVHAISALKPVADNAKPGPEAVLASGAKPPLCWVPKTIDNSAGDLAFVPRDPRQRFGPLGGMLLGTSYGMCSLYAVPFERVGGAQGAGIFQGGVIPLPLNFSSGIMRLRFNPRDGQLYALGLKGWQTRAAFDSGFFRVRYTGKPAHLPVAVHPTKAGVTLTFTDPIDRQTAADVGSYQVLRWNYLYSKNYGSPEFSVADPTKQGRDTMKVTRAALSADGRTVTLAIDDMKPVMQMLVKVNLETDKGNAVKHEVYHTVHQLSEK